MHCTRLSRYEPDNELDKFRSLLEGALDPRVVHMGHSI